MTARRARAGRDERGASLVLAIAFMVIIGAIAGATLSAITSGLNNRQSLDRLRDREYGADGAIEYAIADVRTLITEGAALEPCELPAPPSIGGRTYHVDCDPAPAETISGFLQHNVIFTACEGTAACTEATTIIRAQVNFQTLDSGPADIDVTDTWVQSWSVNA